MYTVTNEYKQAVLKDSRVWSVRGKIKTAKSTINLTDDDFEINGIKRSESAMAGDKFGVGSAVMSDLSLSLINDGGKYDDVQFNGAEVTPEIGLLLGNSPIGSKQAISTVLTGTVTAAGKLKVTVTAAKMTGIKETFYGGVTATGEGQSTAESLAKFIRDAISGMGGSNVQNIHAFFDVGGTGAQIILTAKVADANDATMNISIKNTNEAFVEIPNHTGIEDKPTSTTIAEGESPYENEWVPLGVFNVDTVRRQGSIVSLQAFDNLVKADRPFRDCPVSFPCSALVLLSSVCTYCGISLATTNFLNKTYVISKRPEGDLSCRDIIAYISQIACSFARCSRTGQLELKWFANPGYVTEFSVDGQTGTADGGDFTNYNTKMMDGGVFSVASKNFSTDALHRYDFTADDDPVQITGVTLEKDGKILLAGSDRYTVNLADNPLIEDEAEAVLISLLDHLEGFTYLPFTSSWIGNPAVQAGDLVEHQDRSTPPKTYRTIVTQTKYAYRGKGEISAAGVSETSEGYKDHSSKIISVLRRKIVEKQEQIDALDLAIKNATGLIAGALGGYAIKGEGSYDGNYFISDNPDITKAVRVWRWNIGGFGYSSTGVNGPYTTAITAGGSIVASIITADMIRTGVLQSLDGSSWIDLDNGGFDLGNGSLKWDAVNGFEAVSAKKISNDPQMLSFAQFGYLATGGVGMELYANNAAGTGSVLFAIIAMLVGGGFSLLDENQVQRFAANYNVTIISDNNGKARFYADGNTTRVYGQNEKEAFHSTQYETGIFFGNNGIAVDSTGPYIIKNGIITYL